VTLNIDLEDVPFAILEAVKARILRSRGLLEQYNQQNPKPSLQPGPQFTKQGASSKGWRLPKTAAMALDSGVGLLAAGPASTYNSVGLPVISSFVNAAKFGRYAAGDFDDYVNFALSQGPTAGSLALGHTKDTEAVGYTFASNYADVIDLESCFADPDADDTWIGDLELPAQSLVSPPPSLVNPLALASRYNSFTFEFFVKPAAPSSTIRVSTHNMRFQVAGFNLSFRLSGITTFDAINGSVDVAAVGNETSGTWGMDGYSLGVTAENRWSHMAYCKDGSSIRFYAGGRRVVESRVSPRYWSRYVGLLRQGQVPFVINRSLPVMFAAEVSGSLAGPQLHGMRWTPRCLYQGSIIQAPTSITSLAQ
jgi:hypothetical protein